ncbi:MAG TPA: hypothetical protein DCZ41_02255 [Firmicutes bacterium]|nr:hypothetical protein [Bacillota bacterium]
MSAKLARMLHRGKHPKSSKIDIVFYVVLAVIISLFSLFLLFLLLWGFMTSLKGKNDFEQNGAIAFPFIDWNDWSNPFASNYEFFQFKNYGIIFKNFIFEQLNSSWYVGDRLVSHSQENIGFLSMLMNTLIYAGVGGLICSVVPAITAYLTSKYKYKLSTVINVVFTLILSIPIVGALPSELTWLRQLGIYDSLWGNFLRFFSGAGMYYFVYYGFFNAMSDTYREAAEIDGASDFTIMFRIYFPMAIKTIGTVNLIQFIALWNDWQATMLYLPTHPTLARAVYEMSLQKSDIGTGAEKFLLQTTPLKITASMMLALPITVIFVVFRNKLMGNVSVGGLKE